MTNRSETLCDLIYTGLVEAHGRLAAAIGGALPMVARRCTGLCAEGGSSVAKVSASS